VTLKLSRRRILLASLAGSAVLLAVPAAISANLRQAVASALEPVTGTVRSIGRGARARLAAFGRGTALQQELEAERQAHAQTRARLAEKEAELGRVNRAGEEAKGLRAALERAGWRRGVPVPANVIRGPGRWEGFVLTVDCGSAQDVAPRQAVLAGECALGVVAEVKDRSAWVLTFGHPALVLPAMIVETRQQGLVEASGGRLELRFITRDQQVRPGYQVVTSGLDGSFPPGCLIGKVAPGVAFDQAQPFYKIWVEPAAASANPETVWILTGTESSPPPGPAPGAPKPGPAGGGKKSPG